MSPRREALVFATTLAVVLGGFFAESLIGGRLLSPADVIAATPGFESIHGPGYEPANRLLIDPVLQFQPWLEFNRSELRQGRLPLWNPLAGCGAPHLANGQSAVFDPFHWIAYLGPLPGSLAVVAWARLLFAGLGMFLLARQWGLGAWGRWFCGLAFPLCGFLMVWLLFPVTAAAVWLPWVLLAVDRLLDRRSPRRVGWLGVAVGGMVLGGHVQTAAHGFLAAASYALWRLVRERNETRRSIAALAAALSLGVGLAAVEILPLGVYLARSPVWHDRQVDRPSAWSLGRPRLLDAVCTALPYAFGSQRRGHPNLARAVGVHNLNESAGGFAGLATLLWLAPAAWPLRRVQPRVGFLAGLAGVGAMGAFAVPPVANVLRCVPVLDVIDHRRLTLWTAFGLVMLGGMGLDALGRPARGPRWWGVGALILAAGAVAFGPLAGEQVQARAITHYQHAAALAPGADAEVFHARAERQVQQTLAFVPRYASLAALQLAGLAALAGVGRRGWIGPNATRGILLAVVLTDLVGFGLGLNPATAREDDRPVPELIAYLRREVPPPARFLALGSVLPPNLGLRYGLADVRNYDSVETSRNLAYFADLYEPGGARTSRRDVTWEGVGRSLARLRAARVEAIVGTTEPPHRWFDRVDRVGALWVGRLAPRPSPAIRRSPGRIEVTLPAAWAGPLVIAETFDPGWRATVDGAPAPVRAHEGAFLAVRTPPGAAKLVLDYDPPEVRAGLVVSLVSAMVVALTFVGSKIAARGRKTGSGSWSPSSRRVRIRLMIPTRSSSPVSTEG